MKKQKLVKPLFVILSLLSVSCAKEPVYELKLTGLDTQAAIETVLQGGSINTDSTIIERLGKQGLTQVECEKEEARFRSKQADPTYKQQEFDTFNRELQQALKQAAANPKITRELLDLQALVTPDTLLITATCEPQTNMGLH